MGQGDPGRQYQGGVESTSTFRNTDTRILEADAVSTMLKFAIGMVALILTASGTTLSARAAEDAGAYAELPGVKLWLTDTGGTGVPLVLLHTRTPATVPFGSPRTAP